MAEYNTYLETTEICVIQSWLSAWVVRDFIYF